MAHTVAMKGEILRRTPGDDGPTGTCAGRIVVHLKGAVLLAWAGPDEDPEASAAMDASQHEERDRCGLEAAAEPDIGTTHTSATGSADAT